MGEREGTILIICFVKTSGASMKMVLLFLKLMSVVQGVYGVDVVESESGDPSRGWDEIIFEVLKVSHGLDHSSKRKEGYSDVVLTCR
jgi:hypothetical protein